MKTAVYPGTFDPITNGHTDLVARAARLFDRVIVAVAQDTGKQPVCGITERVELAQAALTGIEGVEVVPFGGLLMEFCREHAADVVIRGLRAVSDFEYEFQLASMNRRMAPEIETMFMMPAEAYSFLSSSLVREVYSLGGSVSGLVPSMVEEVYLREKFKDQIEGEE